MKKPAALIQKFALALASVLLFLLVLEPCLRLAESIWRNIPFNFSPANYEHPVLGWGGKEVFGDPNTTKFKIMIVGDSFTDAGLLKEDLVYYNRLKKNQNVELFIYAAAGYGTLQEYLALASVVDTIKPDLVILQVTSNDIVNNSKILEENSFWHNNLWLRPYLENNVVTLNYPSGIGLIRFQLTKYSRVAYRFFNLCDQVLAQLHTMDLIHSVDQLEYREKYMPAFLESGKVTQQIITKMRSRIGTAELVFLPTMLDDELENRLIRGETDDRHWLAKPAEKIRELSNQGQDVHEPDGAHWNAAGHQIVGEILAQELVEKGFVPDVL